MCVHVFSPPVKSDVGWATMTGVPPTIPSGGENCSAKRNPFHFSCLPARKLSERHFTVCVQVQWSLIFFQSCSETSSVSPPTHNQMFHPLVLDNLASAHLDTKTQCAWSSFAVLKYAKPVGAFFFSLIFWDGEKQLPTASCKCEAENTQIARKTRQSNVNVYWNDAKYNLNYVSKGAAGIDWTLKILLLLHLIVITILTPTHPPPH